MVVLVHFLRRSSCVPGQHFGNGLHHVAVMDRRLSHNYLQSSEKIEGQSCWLAKWNEVQSIWINFFWWGEQDLLRALLQLCHHLAMYHHLDPQSYLSKSKLTSKSESKFWWDWWQTNCSIFWLQCQIVFLCLFAGTSSRQQVDQQMDWSMAFGPHCTMTPLPK